MPIKARASILNTALDEHGGPDGSAQRLIDFSVNSNPFGPPQALLEHLKTIDVSTYPDPTASKARALAAAHQGVQPEHVCFGNGTAELIHRIAACYLHKGDSVLVLTPSFGEYARACKLYGADITQLNVYASEGILYELVLEHIEQHAPKLVWLCHPNNPTGHSWSFDVLQTFANVCEQFHALLIIDAAYLDLTKWQDKRLPTNCLQLHSLTKSFTVAGVRVGYAVAPKAIIQVLNQGAAPWQASAHAQAAAAWMFSQEARAFLSKTVPALLESCRKFQQAIKALGFKLMPSTTNYFLIEVDDARLVKQAAQEAGFRVRDGSSFGLETYIRVATQLAEHNQQFTAWLAQYAKEKNA